MSLFYPRFLIRRWGRMGGKCPRSTRMWMAGGEEDRVQGMLVEMVLHELRPSQPLTPCQLAESPKVQLATIQEAES